MLIPVLVLLALLAVPVLGGRLRRLAELPLAPPWLVPYALAVQVAAALLDGRAARPVVLGLLASSGALAAVFLWLNRSLPGLSVVGVGAGLNALAVGLNAGRMPTSASALEQAGIAPGPARVVDDVRVGALGDVLAAPSWLPLADVLSVGDVLVVLGAAWLAHRSCGSVLGRRPELPSWVGRRRPQPPPPARVVVVPDQFRPRDAARSAAELSGDGPPSG